MIHMDTSHERIGDLVDLLGALISEMKRLAGSGKHLESLKLKKDIRALIARWLANLDGSPW